MWSRQYAYSQLTYMYMYNVKGMCTCGSIRVLTSCDAIDILQKALNVFVT